MIKQQITIKFINYIKYLMDKNNVSARELSNKLEKAPAYISQILTGKIKTITYENAFEILKILMPDNSQIEKILIEQFSIEPDEAIESRLEIMGKEQEQMFERIKIGEKIIERIGNNITEEIMKNNSIDKVLTLEEISKVDFNEENIGELLNMVMGLYKKVDRRRYRLLLLMVDILYMFDGWGASINIRKGEEELRLHMEKFIKGVLLGGTEEGRQKNDI